MAGRLAAGLAACAALAAGGRAEAGSYVLLSAFQANARADVYFQQVSGATNFALPPIMEAGNGYSYTIASLPTTALMSRDSRGVGSVNDGPSTRLTFTGKPVTAFAGTFIVVNQADASVAGTITISTDTGQNFTLSTSATGTFFGFTTSQPFTTVTFNATPANGLYELVDNVYVGSSVEAPIGMSQCADAPTVGVGAYSFTTSGATTDGLAASCAPELASPCVYFRYVPTATGPCTVSTCGCNFDSVLRVRAACGPAGADVACNDNGCPGSTSSMLTFRATAGQAVLVRISGSGGSSGSGTLTIVQTADCPGDFNHSGAANVQDIFDFLTAWFQGCP